jgi:sugar lactone lactonase YvrE
MPWFAKGSLAGRLKPGQPLAAGEVLNLAVQVAEGLSFAHRNGIIHRDLKPANILITADNRACLADFGLARTLFNDSLTEVGSSNLEGTAPYMSPAVAAGDAEDTRCDIYSFGALLYEMLTGFPPYHGSGTREILKQIIAGPPQPITSLNPSADRRLVAVAEGCMARELRDRYADLRDVVRDLERVRENLPPAGPRGSSPAHPPAPVGMRWPLVVLGLVVVLSALAGAGWWLWREQPAPVSLHPAVPAPAPATVPVAAPVTAAPLTAAPLTAAPLTAPVAMPVPVVAKPVIPAPPEEVAPNPPPVVHLPPVWNTSILAGQAGVAGLEDGPGPQAHFWLPNSVAVDQTGNLYVADTASHTIRKISPAGLVTTLAGLSGSHGTTDDVGGQARFSAPFGVAVDAAGTVFVADTANNTIRHITAAGVVTTLAGVAGQAGSADGSGDQARFRNPWSVAVDRSGNVFVADMSNNTIRKITPSGVVSTLAGRAGVSGHADGPARQARFNSPYAVAVDPAGDIYVSDSGNHAIRMISPEGMVSTVAGLPGYPGSADGKGDAARFWNPQGLIVDGDGTVYVADTGNQTIRKITLDGDVTTLAGLAGTSGTNDASGPVARFNNPGGITVDAAGHLYVADTGNHTIRKLVFGPPANP